MNDMNGFTLNELDGITAMVEDCYPLLDMIKRRVPGISIEQVRSVYASIGAKARAGMTEMQKAEALKAKEAESAEAR